MDVYLSKEARQQLRAQALEVPHGRSAGLLLGHRRGARFLVEKVYPCRFGPLPSAEIYAELDGIFEGRIIGFYSAASPAGKAGPKWPPYSYNKLYLEIGLGPKKRLNLRAAVIEYSESFRLVPATMAAGPKGER
jgi:hypothetical protein